MHSFVHLLNKGLYLLEFWEDAVWHFPACTSMCTALYFEFPLQKVTASNEHTEYEAVLCFNA